MTIDLYQTMLENDGEQLVAGDVNDAQRFLASRLFDQLLERLVPARTGVDQEFNSEAGADVSTAWAYALAVGGAHPKQGSANNKVKIAVGTLFQKIANSTGLEPQFLAYTFPGTDEVAIANGDPSHPRIDLIEMQLSYVEDNPQNRAFSVLPIKASLDLHTVTADDDTKIQAKNPGFGGDSISISFAKRSTGVGVTYSENGNAITILYQDGVSTVANVEAAIIASSTLIEIQSTGTGATVLHDPADSFTFTHLAGGADAVIVTESLNKRRQVQCTLTVNQGTPAVAPRYPNADAGTVPICAVFVPAAYTGAAGFAFSDNLSTLAVVHDLRVPLGVQVHYVYPSDFIYDPANWTVQGQRRSIKCTATTGDPQLFVPCPVRKGRLIGVDIVSKNMGTTQMYLNLLDEPNGFADGLVNITSTLRNTSGSLTNLHGSGPIVDSGPVVGDSDSTATITSNGTHGPPVWCNGQRAPWETKTNGNADSLQVGVYLNALVSNAEIGLVAFYVAEGL